MNPQTRNDHLVNVFKHITNNEDYFLGFKYDPLTQKGSCNCANTGFLRFPVFAVRHDKDKSIIYFKSHHGDTSKVYVKSDENFFFNALNKVKDTLKPYAGDWNDHATNPFHPDYNDDDDWNYDLGPKPPSEG